MPGSIKPNTIIKGHVKFSDDINCFVFGKTLLPRLKDIYLKQIHWHRAKS
jgi:hypothetical protein